MSHKKVINYSLEFKESSAKLARNSDKPISQTAKDLVINENTLHGWIRKFPVDSKAASTAVSRTSLEEEVKQLRKENARLKQDREILKKAKKQHLGCKTRRKFKLSTDSNHTLPVAPILNILRYFTIESECILPTIIYRPWNTRDCTKQPKLLSGKVLTEQSRAQEIIDDMVNAVRTHWPEACEHAELTTHQKNLLTGTAVLNPFCFYDEP